MQTQKVPLYQQDLDIRSDAVTLTTAHRAKGREFAVVFIIKAVDGKWGNNSVRELIKLPEGIITHTDLSRKEKNEDERRLFYVAMTRAKNQLIITSSQTYQTSYGRKETAQSMFVAEIPAQYKTDIKIESYEHGVKDILEGMLTPAQKSQTSTDEAAFLKTVISTMKLSPTALNTYLACPYKFKLNNLLRAPRAKDPSLSFGSAVHKALEQFFREFQKTRRLPDKSFLHKSFSAALQREILTPVQQGRLARRGQDTLSTYYQQYHQEFVAPLAVEKFFGYGFSKVILGVVPLGGKIDKIESLGEDLKKVRVIDYKTGRPKSRNEIEGDYKRQLVFYQLLSDLDQNFRFTVAETELDFVEADKNTGKLKKERFAITKDEVEDLKKIIFKVWNDILALKFPRTTEVQKHCPRCQWLLHCWPDGLPQNPQQLSLLN
jgi:DNA helicase-2/ATP-dependent DNA helicase PcrA